MNGRLIVIEGLDGSGKATQTELLYKYILSKNIYCTRLSYPNYESDSSALVKMYLGGELSDNAEGVSAYAASAFYAVDRCADYLKYHKSRYESGGLFISDRYATSNAVYQTAKLPKENWDEFLDWLEDLEYAKLGVPKPDVVIYLDMDINVSQRLLAKRYSDGGSKDIHELDTGFLECCREAAMYCVKHYGWQYIRCDNGYAPRSVEDISDDVIKIASKYI